MGHWVGVYGTLKVGYENYHRHLSGKSPIASLSVDLPFEMYANAEYPMLVPSENGERHPIWLEVFDVDDETLSELDALEAPYGYWRQSIFVDELGENVELYLHPRPPPPGFIRVPSGKWSG